MLFIKKNIILYLVLIILSQTSFFTENELVKLYQTPVTFSFGILIDMNCKIFSNKHTKVLYTTEMYIGKSGVIQLHIKFKRSRLPVTKREAESLIEDISLKVKTEADEMIQGLWRMFPKKVPDEAFLGIKELVSAIVFLDIKQVGFADGQKFYWRKKQRPTKVITNDY
ncbi:MAG: hypothetical protein COB02_05030 [Candidatus Cloacimonadota bacterium]|nr:MAG: hypothetical protein COB02_05030 [Candidatus Cloacimonadota bacterium]